MVTSLSPTGVDLTQDEYLEFWVFQPGSRTTDSAGVRLVLDLGTVNEDALGLAPDTITVTGERHGFHRTAVRRADGRLDTERSTLDIFDAQVDDIGILGDRPDVHGGWHHRCAGGAPAALPADPEHRRAGLPLGRPERSLQPGATEPSTPRT